MLTRRPRSRHKSTNNDHPPPAPNTPKTRSTKSLATQLKEFALKATGLYRSCGACTGGTFPNRVRNHNSNPGSPSERYKWSSSSYRQTSASSRTSSLMMMRRSGGMGSGREVIFVEDREPKEWVAQVDTGVLITFESLVGGGNHLKRIRFSKDIFDKMEAQRWWKENVDMVKELYNVQMLDSQAFPLADPQIPPRSENENAKIDTRHETPATPPLNGECAPSTSCLPTMGMEIGHSSSDSHEQHSLQTQHKRDSGGRKSTPKTDMSSVDVSRLTSSSRADSQFVSNASDMDSVWVDEYEPGVYITIKALSDGSRELKRVRFSREIFGEKKARVWWEENRERVQKQYL